MRITIKDIAKEANVSISTVSRVINNKTDGVGPETRKKILKIIEEKDYRPNALARGLVTKKTKIIGIVLPDISNPFFAEITKGVEKIANKYNYNLFLCNTDDKHEKQVRYIDLLLENRVEGIIMISDYPLTEQQVELLRSSNVAIVYMDRQFGMDVNNGVFLDNLEGGYMATKHLLELGHEKICCMTGPLISISDMDRLNGYMRAMMEYGLEISEDLIAVGNYKMESGYELAQEKLSQGINCFFSTSDSMALGVYKAVKDKGLVIPRDVSIVGFDDIQISEILDPPLTTIRQPTFKMGKSAMKMILNMIQDQEFKKIEINKPKLIVRESTYSQCVKVSSCD